MVKHQRKIDLLSNLRDHLDFNRAENKTVQLF